jgi:hypothetical protein
MGSTVSMRIAKRRSSKSSTICHRRSNLESRRHNFYSSDDDEEINVVLSKHLQVTHIHIHNLSFILRKKMSNNYGFLLSETNADWSN